MVEIIFIGSIFCSLITAYLLLFRKISYQTLSDYTLAFFLICNSYCVLSYLLLVSNWIIEVPLFYKTGAPINYLIPPLGYLYVRSILRNDKLTQKKDLWHFVPFLIFVINYLPFYLMPYQQKNQLVHAVTQDLSMNYLSKDGLFPEYLNYILRPLQVGIYVIFQWKLLINFKKTSLDNPFIVQTNAVLKWLKVFTWANSGVFFSFIIIILFVVEAPQLNTALDFIPSTPSIFYAAMLLLISSYLITHPEVFVGLPYIKKKLPVTDSNFKPEEISTTTDFENEIQLIEQYFNNNTPFLQSNISINDVSVALGIPARSLSFILNNHFQQRFTDFINTYRIRYVNEKISAGYLNEFTIESLANSAGFSSKSTFHAAFKKVNQCTPKEFESSLAN